MVVKTVLKLIKIIIKFKWLHL